MAHFAELDQTNTVLRVIVVDSQIVIDHGGDYSIEAEEYLKTIIPLSPLGISWKQTSYNNNARKIFAGKGMKYNSNLDMFITGQPYSSWTLSQQGDWIPPIAQPLNTFYQEKDVYEVSWDETNQKWIAKSYLAQDITWNTSNNSWE
jgi:hypothetical protein